MKRFYEKIAGYTGSVSGATSILGSYQLCHNICLGVVALLSVIGITLTGLPLMFLEKISIPVWTLAVILLGVTGTMLLKKTCMSRKLFMANTGIVIAGIPFKALQVYVALFWIIGGLLVAGSITWAVSDKLNKGRKVQKRPTKNNTVTWLLTAGVVIVAGVIVFNTISLFRLSASGNNQITGAAVHKHGLFTEFDEKMAYEFMDKNNDGMCDTCGMPVDECMEMGMMECSMGPDAKMGLLKSAHTHVDWKTYINGKQMDMIALAVPNNDPEKTSMFVHVEAGKPPEQIGDVLHIHATGVPLSLFFKSVGLDFTTQCLTWTDEEYCNDKSNTLKFYVNGKQNSEFGSYVPQNKDKILISYGPKDEDISKQLASITDFTSTHYTKN